MGVGAGLYMHFVVVQKFTFAISSPDEFLSCHATWSVIFRSCIFSKPTSRPICPSAAVIRGAGYSWVIMAMGRHTTSPVPCIIMWRVYIEQNARTKELNL